MSCFPIVLIPSEIERTKLARPPLPSFSERLPQQPGDEPKKVNTTIVAVQATTVTVPSIAITSQGATVPGIMIFLAGIGAIATRTWRQIATYTRRKQKYARQVVDYSERLQEYDQKKRQHEEEVRSVSSPKRVAEFRYKLLLQVLRQTIAHDGDNSKARRGWSEAQFSNHLKRYFSGKIHERLTLNIPNYDYPYSPDFAYIDDSLNLHIDIEVDEPYINGKSQPTHFVGAWRDNQRNNFFIEKGWIVIRFSEEQVIRYPESCCKTVAQVIAQVTGHSSILNQLSNVPDLLPMKQWTEMEARQMASRKYRQNYSQAYRCY